jgi:hypothetical protein
VGDSIVTRGIFVSEKLVKPITFRHHLTRRILPESDITSN